MRIILACSTQNKKTGTALCKAKSRGRACSTVASSAAVWWPCAPAEHSGVVSISYPHNTSKRGRLLARLHIGLVCTAGRTRISGLPSRGIGHTSAPFVGVVICAAYPCCRSDQLSYRGSVIFCFDVGSLVVGCLIPHGRHLRHHARRSCRYSLCVRFPVLGVDNVPTSLPVSRSALP